MKTKIFTIFFAITNALNLFAQDRTTVTANSAEISDNLDLRAVASIFGDSQNLEDFERRLNNPRTHISNLDLNNDNQVDYLRVIETVEGRAHLIVIQSVLGRDVYQDIATVEVEKDRFNRIQVQVVGDVFMYGNNYIYQPVYAYTPVIYSNFWVPRYRPYCSLWQWDYYPSFYIAWSPFPIYSYQNHINICINNYNTYNYVNVRNCSIAYNNYRNRRANGYELRYPERAFERRNTGIVNRYELDTKRNLNSNQINQNLNIRNNYNVNNTRNNTLVNNSRNDYPSAIQSQNNNAIYNDSPKNIRNNNQLNTQPERELSNNYDSPRNVRNNNQLSSQPERELSNNYDSPRNVRNNNQLSSQPERELNYSYDTPRNVRNNVRNQNQVSELPVRANNTPIDSPRNTRNNIDYQSSSQSTRNLENNTRNYNSPRVNQSYQNNTPTQRVGSISNRNRRS